MKRGAFTLIEVLISIALLSLIMLGLNRSVELLRDSNTQLFRYLSESKDDTKVLDTLYKDIIGSDGNLSNPKDEFSRFCIAQTVNSLYELPAAKVCWVVLKKDKQLIRIEGNGYTLPVKYEEKVEIDPLMKHLELFDVYHENDKVLVMIKEEGKKSTGFMIQGLMQASQKALPGQPRSGQTPEQKTEQSIPSQTAPRTNVPVTR